MISQISRNRRHRPLLSAIFVAPTALTFAPFLFHLGFPPLPSPPSPPSLPFLLCVHCADNTGAGFFYVTVGENEAADTAKEKKEGMIGILPHFLYPPLLFLFSLCFSFLSSHSPISSVHFRK